MEFKEVCEIEKLGSIYMRAGKGPFFSAETELFITYGPIKLNKWCRISSADEPLIKYSMALWLRR